MTFAKQIFHGVIILIISFSCGCGAGNDKQNNQSDVMVDPAQVEKINPLIVDDLYRSVATVKSKNTAQISSKVMGYVLAVNVKEGDTVNEGDVLVVLQSKELESRLEGARNALSEIESNISEAEAAKAEAHAQLNLAEITFLRFKDLRERESVSQQEFDQANAGYEVAKARKSRSEQTLGSFYAKKKQVAASLDEAKTFYDYTHLKAPFGGLISQKMVDEGSLASPGTPLVVLEDNTHYQLEAVVDESKSGTIKIGQEIDVNVDALGEKKIKGKVAEVIPHIDSVSRTFQVKIDLPVLPQITSGMFGKAYFPMGKRTMMLVPKGALLECGELSSLLVVNQNGRVERRLVKEGKEYQGKVEILSGLNFGESIVARDVFKVKEGCLVGKKP
jgi:RND family efflux transporter MFP subunit